MSVGKTLKSFETFRNEPQSFSPLKPAHPTVHMQQHCVLHHALKRLPSKMGHAFVLVSKAGNYKSYNGRTRAKPAEWIMGNHCYPLQSFSGFSKVFSGIIKGWKLLNVLWRPWIIVLLCCANKREIIRKYTLKVKWGLCSYLPHYYTSK